MKFDAIKILLSLALIEPTMPLTSRGSNEIIKSVAEILDCSISKENVKYAINMP